ncbi:hypothetical protein N9435_02440 [Pseudomonadales bacterium]|nr:hypothetical protein [Pseudomonadales bacterium]MDC0894469.1 hypothetical protein [Pseudomonadales bacterium]
MSTSSHQKYTTTLRVAAGHAFLNYTRPHMYREEQAGLAWEMCVTWLDSQMRSGVSLSSSWT